MRSIFGLLLLILCLNCADKVEEPLTVTFTGDVILDRGVSDKLRIYGDSIIEQSLKPFLNSDFNVINLETVLTNKKNSTKNGFAFRHDPSIAENLALGNVTHASVANNHSYDYDSLGFANTKSALDMRNIISLGTSCEPTILSKGRQSLAIMAFAFTNHNEHLCLNNINDLLLKVKEFEATHSEIPLILYLHWGLEYKRGPVSEQTHFAHVLIDSGADVIIGHHPHVFQCMEYYDGKPIIYSLGNFVADAYLPHTTKGIVAKLMLENQRPTLSFTPVNLSSYIPSKMSHQDQVQFLLENLKFSKNMCFYEIDGQWFIKEIEDINFSENATEWLFHYQNEHQIVIKPLISGGHKLTLFKNGVAQKSLSLNGELSEITIGDINNDNDPEILLGITKKVNFDQRERKRLNIFKVENNGIQVVWLGTHLLYDLQSFRIGQNGNTNYLHTIEKDSLNNMKAGIYEWDEFGFALKIIKPLYAAH